MVNSDPVLVKSLWSPVPSCSGQKALRPMKWSPSRLIRVTPTCGMAHGVLRGITSVVKAVIKGQTPDLGTRGAVDL